MKIKDESLVRAMRDFFQIYLPRQRCCSENTVSSYRYAVNLFLDYMREERSVTLLGIGMDDINRDTVNGFLEWLSDSRGNSPGTCNQRLMALKSFARYLGLNDFSMTAVYAETCLVPVRKQPAKTVSFLSEPALKELLKQPDTGKPTGQRNQFFMILMYDTAARCQEVLDIRLGDFRLDAVSPYVYLKGKGNKIRTVPLMDATVRHLQLYLSLFHPDGHAHPENYLFYTVTHKQRHQMSTDTVETFMKKYGESARSGCKDIPERVHPHQMRHTRAIHLYRNGMPLALLSDFLGHASIETTRIYAYADTEMKRNAIEKSSPSIPDGDDVPTWDISDENTLRRLAGLK